MFARKYLKYFSFLLISVFITGCTEKTETPSFSTDVALENTPKVFRYGITQNKLAGGGRNIPLEKFANIKINIPIQGEYDFKTGAFDVYEDIVYFLNKNGDIYAINAIDKKIIWQQKIDFPAQAIFRGWIKIVDNVVVAIGNNGVISGHDKNTGDVLWQRKLVGDVNSNPKVYNNNIIFQQVGSITTSIDTATGNTNWRHTGSTPDVSYLEVAPIIISDGIAYILYSKGELFALNVETGAEYWGRVISNAIGLEAEAYSTYFIAPLLINNNKIYALSSNRGLYAMNRKTGKTIWKRPISGSKGMDKMGEVLFILSDENKVHAIDIENGNEYWSLQLQNEINDKDIEWNNIIVHRGRIILLSDIGKIQLLSLDNGRTIAIHKGGANSIAPIKERALIYILQNDGIIKVYR